MSTIAERIKEIEPKCNNERECSHDCEYKGTPYCLYGDYANFKIYFDLMRKEAGNGQKTG